MNGFKLFLIQKELKPLTVKRHVWEIERLIKAVGVITPAKVQKHILYRLDSGIKRKTINCLICSLRRYSEYVGDPALANFKIMKPEPVSKKILSQSELTSFLNLPPPNKFSKKIYNHFTIFYKIMAYTGMRPSEVANLTKDSIDLGRGVFEIADSKTNTPRLVPIPEPIQKDVLCVYKRAKPLLFTTLQGRKITATSWAGNFQRRLKRLGIQRKGLTCYSLRHSFITAMLDEDVNIFKVQKIVGHRQINTTAQYTHLTTKDIQRAIRKHPLVKRTSSDEQILQAVEESVKEVVEGRFLVDVTHTKNGIVLKIKKRPKR